MKLKNILILAGGSSSRFWPLSHKNLFSFRGEALIEYQIKFYLSYAESIFIVSHPDTFDQISEIAQKYHVKVLMQHNSGQGAAILSANEHISGETLIVNANDIFNQSLVESLLEEIAARQDHIDGIFTAKKVETYFPGGYLVLDGSTVKGVTEKPGPDKMPSPYWKFVVDYFSNINDFMNVLSSKQASDDDQYEQAITEYINQGKHITMLEYDKDSATVKYPWNILDAMEFFLRHTTSYVSENAHVAPTAIIQGNVYIDDGAKIHEYSKIVGPAYIGKNVTVGNYALITSSMVEQDSMIGGYTEITRSYIGPLTWSHRAYIGDSIVEGPANFAAGSVTANLRFDKKNIHSPVKGERTDSQRTKLGVIAGRNVEIGTNATTMPGVKLAPDTKVMPGSVVFKDNE